ncbi:MAG: isopentenyl phosphate kinase [Halobacteria archaeon]
MKEGKKLRILKIGGSVLTEKKTAGGLKLEEIKRIASEIASKSENLILVHGAGSQGHPQAKAYKLTQGLRNENFAGVLITHEAVRNLNDCFIKALLEQGVKAAPVHPFSSATLKDGRIVSFECKVIETMLEKDILPVLHGDVAMDVKKGVGILSGDQIVVYLAKQFKAKQIGLGTDVEGVLDKNGVLIPVITPQSFKALNLWNSKDIDVTGGMLGKVEELIELAKAGIKSRIFNAAKKGYVEAFLSGEENFGTLIKGE